MSVLSKVVACLNTSTIQNLQIVAKRHGHARSFIIRHGKSYIYRTIDHVHFHWMLGLMIFGLPCLYLNLVYGDCVLTEIPEGYEPRYWEYENKPYTQMLSKYFRFTPQLYHEKFMSLMDEDRRKREFKFQEERAHHLMFERGDYKAWYYIPYKAKWVEWSAFRLDRERDNRDAVMDTFVFHRQ